VKQVLAVTAIRGATLALIVGLGGCSMIRGWLPDDKIDYRSGARKTQPLDVPPDLTPLAADNRYAPQQGVISASDINRPNSPQAAASAATAASEAKPAQVALNALGDVRIVRMGQQQWIYAAKQTPDDLWPKVRQFWLNAGFKFQKEDPSAGVLETDWLENRAKLPNDIIRSTIGKYIDGLYSTGERDRYTVRLVRGENGGTEIYLTDHGLQEVYTGREGDSNLAWTARATDHAAETEMLTRLMQTLAGPQRSAESDEDTAAAMLATPAASVPESDIVVRSEKARLIAGRPGASMEVDDGLERTWRRVGLALDRSGFTVEERDRALGTYSVRYVDPKIASEPAPNFIKRWFFGAKDPAALALGHYRIVLKSSGTKTEITVQKPTGEPDNSASAQRIAKQLVDELKF
jgi:outer membrane protein assembly factor BamC